MFRRTFLKLSSLGLLAGLAGCDAMGGVFGRMFAVPPRDTTYFTPNDKFYIVQYSNSPFSLSHDLNQEQWRLHITGEVKQKISLGWRDILNRESFDQIVTLECIDTLPGGDSLGTAQWRGISLKKLLLEVGVDEETARDIVFRAADGYHDSIPFARAMQDDVMLAYLMNGEKLPKEHGFPLRLIVPGLHGITTVTIRDTGNNVAGPTMARLKFSHALTAPATTSHCEGQNRPTAAWPSAAPTVSAGLN